MHSVSDLGAASSYSRKSSPSPGVSVAHDSLAADGMYDAAESSNDLAEWLPSRSPPSLPMPTGQLYSPSRSSVPRISRARSNAGASVAMMPRTSTRPSSTRWRSMMQAISSSRSWPGSETRMSGVGTTFCDDVDGSSPRQLGNLADQRRGVVLLARSRPWKF